MDSEGLLEHSQTRVWAALDRFSIELPSWGFANTGTRFGKFLQAEAATTLEEKFADAAEVHRLTGAVSGLALHVLWDTPGGVADSERVRQLAEHHGIRPGSINPNLFQAQEYKHGSLCNADAGIRRHALEHVLESISLARELSTQDISLWLADGSSYPGTQSIARRIDVLHEALVEARAHLSAGQRLLIEYKPFEPYFYHTDLADWGMALEMARCAGPQARVLIDMGHHYQAQNIEQIVAWLLRVGMLGGLHLNDRRYADDDLTLGSLDPYQVFRIFHELNTQNSTGVAWMIDQSHNLKGKVEAAVQTLVTAQELYARAALVDQARLAALQDACRIVEAEELFRGAFWTDVRPLVRAWREAHGLPADPLTALRAGGYVERIARERSSRTQAAAASYA